LKAITERRKVGKKYEYLVSWKNQKKGEPKKTWESGKSLREDLGDAYMNRIDKKLS